MNIFVSPIFALTFATVFIIVGGYCLKCILFYYENRENIFNSEKELNQKLENERKKTILERDYN